MAVSLVSRSADRDSGAPPRRCCGHRRQASSSVEEAPVLLRGADGDPQAPVEAVPRRAVPHQHRAVQQVGPHPLGGTPEGAEQDEVGLRGPRLDGQVRQTGLHSPALLGHGRHPLAHGRVVLQCEQPGQLRGRREPVREGHLLAGVDHLGVRDEVAQPDGGECPGLGERPDHPEAPAGALLDRRLPRRRPAGGGGCGAGAAQVQRRPVRELAVGLVHHHQPGRTRQHVTHQTRGFDPARRVVRRAQERDDRRAPPQGGIHLLGGQREVLRTLDRHHRRAGQAGDVAVQRVGGLEGEHLARRPAVGEQQRLQDLVGPVGAEHLRRLDPVVLGDRLSQLGAVAVGVAVEVDPPDLARVLLPPLRRWPEGGFVGVEADLHVDLRRVVSRQGLQVGAEGGQAAHPRSLTDSAWAGRPSVVARIATW